MEFEILCASFWLFCDRTLKYTTYFAFTKRLLSNSYMHCTERSNKNI